MEDSLVRGRRAGSDYKIRVQSRTRATKYDDSDKNFTVTDSKSTRPNLTLSCSPSSASESGGTFTLSLSETTTETVTAEVEYSGKATPGTDYTGNITNHTITAGDDSTSWTITGTADSETERDESIKIKVISVTNAKEQGNQKESLTLTDYDVITSPS